MLQRIQSLIMSAFTSANNDTVTTDDAILAKAFPTSKADLNIPQITGNLYLIDGEIKEFTKATEAIATAIYVGGKDRIQISTFGRCDKDVALAAVDAASRAWDRGLGEWPQASVVKRAAALKAFLVDFKARKQLLADLLMWDICKTRKDAMDEVERTIGMWCDLVDDKRG